MQINNITQRREFELQLTLSIAPSITDYYLRLSSQFVKRQFTNNPKLSVDEVLQKGISDKVRDHICSHTEAIVRAMSANLFSDADPQCQPQASVAESRVPQESPRMAHR